MLKIARYYVSLCVFLFLALSVSFKGSYGITGPLIISSYVFLFSSEVRSKIHLSSAEKGLVLVLLGYLVSVLLEIVIYQAPWRVIDPESKILLFIPLIFLLNSVRIHYLIIILGAGVGALGLFLLAVYEKYYLGLDRVGSFINAIQLGNIAMTLSLISLLLSPIAFRAKKLGNFLGVIMIVFGLLGFAASLFTLTRGGLVFFPILVLVVCFYNARILKKHYKVFGLVIVVVAISAATVLPGSGIVSRFSVALDNYGNYFDKSNVTTSTGIRLELWKTAALISIESPVYGVGVDQYTSRKSELIQSGVISPSVEHFGNPHNAYLYATARRGGVGLLVFLMLLFYPIYIAHREISFNKKVGGSSSSAMALLIFGLFFVFANITQVLFAHNSGMIMYTGLIILLVSLMVSLKLPVSEVKLKDEC